jgi:sulfur carrier protein ThiS
MDVDVELFSVFRRDRFRKGRVRLAAGASVADLLALLSVSPDDVGVLMVNGRDGTFGQVLKEGDFVTLIPPMGGG